MEGHMLPIGLYFHESDYSYEKITTYHLRYLISSALLSINKIISANNVDEFENEIYYYRFFVDHLMDCIGIISDCFNKSQKHRDRLNCINYCYTKEKYPLISSKELRNIVEHIDDRTIRTIDNLGGVGGFCVIGVDSNDMAKDIEENPWYYPYYLDKRNNELHFYEINKSDSRILSLIRLKEELISLFESVNEFGKKNNW